MTTRTVLSLCLLLTSQSLLAENPLVSFDSQRSIKGLETTKKAEGFLGIRFAQPPTGNNRFRPTVTPEPSWVGGYDATQFRSACPQLELSLKGSSTGAYFGSEDCLFLNIYRPSKRKGMLPVMVWIHGGGFTTGSGSDGLYEGNALAEKGTVVVTFNYRLGRLGFLAHPALTKRLGFPSGNFALYDQIAALKWIKANISKFGGDPTQITVFGESAGASAVRSLLISPATNGLFTNAILQSSAMAEPVPPSKAEARGTVFAQEAGCGQSDLGAAANCLLNLSPETLVKSTQDFDTSIEWAFNPNNFFVLDKRLLVGNSISQAKAGGISASSILIGNNTGDGIVLMSMYKNGIQIEYTAAEFKSSLTRGFGSLLGSNLYKIYDPKQYPSVANAINALRTDFDFACASRQFARALRQSPTAPKLYRYVFDGKMLGRLQFLLSRMATSGNGELPLTIPFPAPWPALHGTDVPYVFQNIDKAYENLAETTGRSLKPVPYDNLLQTLVGNYWTSFAKTSSPRAPLSPNWPAYELRAERGLRIDVPAQIESNWENKGCDLYDTLHVW